jgi:hypothetical protein
MKRFAAPLLFLACAGVLLVVTSACRRTATTDTATTTPPHLVAVSSPSPAGTSPAAAAPAAASTATKAGWWIRINPGMTTAQTLTFQIGTGKLQREEWRVWNAGEPVEFDVPEKYQQVPRLYIRSSLSPIGRIGTLCMMYKNRGVEHMSFDDDDSETKSQTEIDIKCR